MSKNSTNNIIITNGTGQANIANAQYTVTAIVKGYDNSTVSPASITVSAGVDVYSFTIAANGTLTLHVTEEGILTGTAVAGAIFYRCDSNGTTYGTAVTTDTNGNATLLNVPYGTSALTVYYKQTASDGQHEFDSSVQSITLATATQTVEIANALAAERTINLTDANYTNLPIESGTITLTD